MSKNLSIKGILFVFIGLIFQHQVLAQKYVDKQTKELNFNTTKKVFILKNIFGDVTIEGTSGTKAQLNYTESITADSKEIYQKVKKDLKVKIENSGDTVMVYISSPYIEVKKYGDGINYHMHDYPKDHDFHYDFTAKVPMDAELIVSTVNDGDIDVIGITGKMKIRNVNGSISLTAISGQTSAVTVNGGINVDYSKNPSKDCNFKTINGDIKVLCNKSLSADINYKSMNGEFYTNYSISSLSPEIVKEQKRKGKTSFYKLGHKPKFCIGSGNIDMTFETLNGDMTVKYK